MAEIRLICPGCAAEYRVPETAIPPEGREVECSACGNVWHAEARPGPLAPAPAEGASNTPPEAPRLNRRLPDTVLDILRDEVEHERRARAAQDVTLPAPVETSAPVEPPMPPRAMADPEWPATTITRHVEARSPEHPPFMARQPQSAPIKPAPLEPAPIPPRPAPRLEPLDVPAKRAVLEPAAPLPQQTAAPVKEPVPPAVVALPAARSARGGYGAGFGVAMLLSAACVALYLLAPALSHRGTFGDNLMQIRGQVDEARLWLQDRAAPLAR